MMAMTMTGPSMYSDQPDRACTTEAELEALLLSLPPCGRMAESSGLDASTVHAAQGLTVLQIHPEYAPGQFECSVAPADALTTAGVMPTARSQESPTPIQSATCLC